MEERLEELEKSNRMMKVLLIIVIILLLAIIAAAVGGALYAMDLIKSVKPVFDTLLKFNFDEISGVMDSISNIDFDKINETLKAADAIKELDFDGLASAIENFKETGEMLGEFNDKISSFSSFFGK